MPKCTLTGYTDFWYINQHPTVPVREERTWLTDNIEMHDGGEERSPLRFFPRERLEYSYIIKTGHAFDTRNSLREGIRGKWLVPVWKEAVPITGVSGDRILCAAAHLGTDVNRLVAVYRVDTGLVFYPVVNKFANGIEVADLVTPPAGAMLVPVREGVLVGDVDRDAGGYDGTLDLTYALTDTLYSPPNLGILIAMYRGWNLFGQDPAPGSPEETWRVTIRSFCYWLANQMEALNGRVDIGLQAWPISGPTSAPFVRLNATPTQIRSVGDYATGISRSGQVLADSVFVYANDFFSTVSPNDGLRDDILFFTMGTVLTVSDPSDMAPILQISNKNAPFNGVRAVDVLVSNMGTGTYDNDWETVDNVTPPGALPNVGVGTDLYNAMVNLVLPKITKITPQAWLTPPIAEPDTIPRVIYQDYETVDYEIGGFIHRTTWEGSKKRTEIHCLVESLQEWYSFLDFFDGHQGVAGQFWMPTFERDLRNVSLDMTRFDLTADADGLSVDIPALGILFTDGTWQIAEVADQVVLGGSVTFTLDAAVQDKEILYVCFAGQWRFESDTLTVEWVDHGVGRFSFGLVEVLP